MLESDNGQTPQRRLLIIDGHAYAYRAFYAIRQLSSAVTGKPTNAIYGFIRMLGKIQAYVRPTHLIVVWDGGLCEKRMALHPDYKIHRPAMPAALESQLDEIGRFLSAAKISTYCREAIEADDWIATLAHRTSQLDFSVVIASADKDFLQLVDEKVGLLNPNDKEQRVWTASEVRAKADVEPTQIVDWLSLIGDSVDNIPGVPGIGPTTASKLLRQFGSIEAIYRNLREVTPQRVQVALEGAEGIVRRNQRLITLNVNLPDVFCCDDLLLKEPDYKALSSLYQEWGFKTLQQEAEQKSGLRQEFLL